MDKTINDKIVKAKREYWKEYRDKNRDKINSYHREWRDKNKDKVKEYNKNYWLKRVNNQDLSSAV